MKNAIVAPLLGACLLVAMTPVAATQADAGLRLEQVVGRVLARNPQLQQFDTEARAAGARVRQAGQGTPYRLGLELENILGTGPFEGMDTPEATLSLSRVLETGGKPGHRAELARSRLGQLRTEQDARRLDVLAAAARQFVRVVGLQQQVGLARDELELVRANRESVRRRVEAGRSPDADLARADIAVDRTELALAQAHSELDSARLGLAVHWAATTPDFNRAEADLFRLPGVEPFDHYAAQLERNPDLARFATRARLAEARQRLAAARATPDVELGGGLRYLGEGDEAALLFSARIPLGSRSRAEPYRAEADNLALLTPWQREQQRLELHAALYAIHRQLRQARERTLRLRGEIIPAAERVLDDYSRGYARGRYSLLDLTQARRTLLELRREALAAATDYHLSRVELDRLIGVGPDAGVQP
ncbi:outer membrane protein [Thiohalobacter thiocyanaticus]|uniref:Outer membrane protein n=1 Tax=Thiohalobacter thiocyanaticus TaxID=585455 RepID=A0A1Z4VV08_9GAMM|nr:TolC family protein [Thiohalobacter thiocyanaticus]BAZ95218.1 outer membrane protein [Thiohalobacter thiocyanaticus]